MGLRRSLILSIIAHLVFFAVWGFVLLKQPTQISPEKLTWIDLEPVGKKRTENVHLDKRKKVVQTLPAERVEKAGPDSFLGWQNQIVNRQTVSKNKSTVLGSIPKRSHPSRKSPLDESNQIVSLSRLGISIIPSKPIFEKDEPNWATPGVRPEDFVDGIQESDRTVLNTREFQFYGYFQRIRSRLDQAWIPILREKLIAFHRSGRNLASNMEHTTRVVVSLNKKGEIVRVQMVGESGVSDLDAAAVAAFNQAGPFPNPPQGMIDHNQEVQIPWDFILKT